MCLSERNPCFEGTPKNGFHVGCETAPNNIILTFTSRPAAYAGRS